MEVETSLIFIYLNLFIKSFNKNGRITSLTIKKGGKKTTLILGSSVYEEFNIKNINSPLSLHSVVSE